MDDKKRNLILLSLLVVAALVALGLAVSKSSGSGETVTKFESVPPKGIGKHERD